MLNPMHSPFIWRTVYTPTPPYTLRYQALRLCYAVGDYGDYTPMSLDALARRLYFFA